MDPYYRYTTARYLYKRFPMHRTYAELMDRLVMLLCTISFVFRKAVFGKICVEFFHNIVSVDLGNDGSGRDGENLCIAGNNCFLFHFKILPTSLVREKKSAIDEEKCLFGFVFCPS